MKNDSGPEELNLVLVLDRDWKRSIKVKTKTVTDGLVTKTNFDYDGYEAKMQIKKRPGGATALLTLQTSDYTLTLSSGQIDILLDRATINASGLTEGAYYYDIAITDSAGTYDHIYGRIDVKLNVTNA